MANIHPDLARKNGLLRSNSLTRKESLKRSSSLRRKGSAHSTKRGTPAERLADLEASTSHHDNQSDRSSAYSLSLENVPPRSSSRNHLESREPSCHQLRRPESSKPSLTTLPRSASRPPRAREYAIPSQSHSGSPSKYLGGKPGIKSCVCRTFTRTMDPNTDAVDFPTHRHPRLQAELQIGASLFAGGGSIEGHVRVVMSDLERIRHKRQMAISRISIDLLGVEEMSGGRRSVFLNLATELIDGRNPPPREMVESLLQISPVDPFWYLTPATCRIPFILSLPLDVGPPPFHSKHARIRYLLAATILIRDSGKQYLVRSSQNISVISVYDRMISAFASYQGC